jgi:hypothetical protein
VSFKTLDDEIYNRRGIVMDPFHVSLMDPVLVALGNWAHVNFGPSFYRAQAEVGPVEYSGQLEIKTAQPHHCLHWNSGTGSFRSTAPLKSLDPLPVHSA